MRLLIVTGLSGAGKSQAVDTLEDLGYFCVDNLPPRLTLTFIQLLASADEPRERVAVVMDARAGGTFLDVFWALNALRAEKIVYELLFLDAADETLERRYKETRRQHPLCGENPALSLPEAVKAERELLAPLREQADLYVDTSSLSPADFRGRVTELFAESSQDVMRIHVNSFGFKHGAPRDSDLLFDVRCLHNPFYIPELKDHTGLEDVIAAYVFSFPEAAALFDKILDMLLFLLPLYRREGKSILTVSFGCTGGKHRSVLFARRLAEELKRRNFPVHVKHRDL